MASEKIKGIHNYCDRWCERCAFSSRCALFEEEAQTIIVDEKETGNQAFLDRLSANFSKAQDLLYQAAERQGIDLNEIAKEVQVVKQKENTIRERSKDHALSKLSSEYAATTHAWLKEQPGMIKKLEQLRKEIESGELQHVARNTLHVIQDSLDVIQWYEDFISVKLTRALMGKIDLGEEDEEFINDSDGSAKVAILGIDRSRQAFEKLFGILPAQEDDFLTILGMLERMKRLALIEFPDALTFKRPGFDE